MAGRENAVSAEEGRFRPAKSPAGAIAWAAFLLVIGVGMFTAGVVLWAVDSFKAGKAMLPHDAPSSKAQM